MAETNSTMQSQGRYVVGGVSEVNSTPAIEWWERNVFNADPTDRTYVVEQKFAGRLDLIAASYLNNSRFWWFLAQYNAILDPYNEITVGRVLYIPTTDRVQKLMVGKLGGVTSTRVIPLTNISPIV